MVRTYEVVKRCGVETLLVTIRRDFDKTACMCISIRTDGNNCSFSKREDVTAAQVYDELYRVYSLLEEPHWRAHVRHNCESLGKFPEYGLFASSSHKG